MNKEIFWSLIENAKNSSNDDQEFIFKNLLIEVSKLSDEEVYAFQNICSLYVDIADSIPILMACQVMNNNTDKDTFTYFRTWIISQGKVAYIKALENPDSLASIDPSPYAQFEMLLGVGYYTLSTRKADVISGFSTHKLSDTEINSIRSEINFYNKTDLNSGTFDSVRLTPIILPNLCSKYNFNVMSAKNNISTPPNNLTSQISESNNSQNNNLFNTDPNTLINKHAINNVTVVNNDFEPEVNNIFSKPIKENTNTHFNNNVNTYSTSNNLNLNNENVYKPTENLNNDDKTNYSTDESLYTETDNNYLKSEDFYTESNNINNEESLPRDNDPLSKFDKHSNYSEGLCAVSSNDKWGFVDSDLNTIIPIEYDAVYDFLNGITPVKSNNKWGYIDSAGNKLTPMVFDVAYSFNNRDYALVEIGDKKGLIDSNGQKLIPVMYDDLELSPSLRGFLNNEWTEFKLQTT